MRLRQDLKDRDDGIVPPPRITVAGLLDEWLEDASPSVSRRTHVNMRSRVHRHLKPRLGGVVLAGIARRL